MITSTPAIDCRTSAPRVRGRLIVRCDIDHFIPSGLSVPELFASLRPQLVAAIKDAAARDHDGDGAPRPPSVAIDVGFADPSITLSVNSPSASLLNLDECLGKLEAILESLIATERPPGPHDGSLVWLGDNLGGDGPVLVDARSHFGQVGLDLEEALRRIDQFDAVGQQRLMAGLRQHFDVDLGAAR